jgi:hypothetical protein
VKKLYKYYYDIRSKKHPFIRFASR